MSPYGFVVLLSLQSLGDVRDGLDRGLQLLWEGEIGAGAVDELPQVRAHAVGVKSGERQAP